MSEFKGTRGNFKEDIGIDLLGHDDELMQIIIFSKEVNTHNVAHVFGLSQEEVMANAKLFVKSKEMLEMLQKIVLMTETCQGTFEDFRERYNIEIKQLIKQATEL